MKKNKIIHVVGARPNFVKAAPVMKSLNSSSNIEQILIHTGQHYSKSLSDSFFKVLKIKEPDYNLNVGSGSHAKQTAKVMEKIEDIFIKELPDIVIVYGDVNSTLAAALTASKLNIKVAHVESGLRSFDNRMPEEKNRIIVDRISDILFVTEQSGLTNLKAEGVDTKKVYFVGNTMIDSLVETMKCFDNFKKSEHVLATFHRPSNVDSKEDLMVIYRLFNSINHNKEIIFPMHPRTLNSLKNNNLFKLFKEIKNLTMIEPAEYREFLELINSSIVVITDSGGIQEETTFMNIPCITFRENTERPSTITVGTNILEKNVNVIKDIVNNDKFKYAKRKPVFWDGSASDRIKDVLIDYLEDENKK